jgi:hypothetical protein
VNKETGLTIDAIPISKRTGIVKEIIPEKISVKSSLRNEAIHIAVLAKTLINQN